MAPNIFPFRSIPLYAAAEALLYIKLQASSNKELGNHSFVKWLAIFTTVNFFVYVVFWYYIHAYWISPLRRFPITKKSSREGMLARTKMDSAPGSNFLTWMASTPNDGVIRTPFPMVNNLLLTSPQAIADVLVHQTYNFEKPKAARDVLREPLGDGLIIVEGDVHKFQRKHLMPSFAFRHIKQLYPMMWSKSLSLMDMIGDELASQPVGGDEKKAAGRLEIGTWANKATLDIIGVAGIGKEFNALRNHEHQLAKDYEELLAPDGMRIFHFFLTIMVGWGLASKIPIQTNYDLQRLVASLHNESRRIVKEKRAAIDAGGEHLDILGLLIKSNDFSDEELKDQVLTFLAAGHETTSSAFTWATYLLSKHPEIRKQLRDEVRTAFPNIDTDPQSPEIIASLADTLEKLPILNGVCQETLRLYPTVPITIREANKATTLQGKPIPKGTHVILCPWAINRAPHLWGPDADKFMPQRWISEDGKANNHGGSASNYNLLTFLHGPRSCIGQGFARAELRCLLAAMILRFDWELDMDEGDVVPAGVITIKPKKGMYIRMRKVD